MVAPRRLPSFGQKPPKKGLRTGVIIAKITASAINTNGLFADSEVRLLPPPIDRGSIDAPKINDSEIGRLSAW
jgi:hypothetical protein